MARDLAARFRTYALRERLIPAGSGVVVGVSGRSDSVALLHLLHELAPELALRLTVAHVQRGSGAAAAGDAAFVRDRTDALGVEFDHYVGWSDLDGKKSDPAADRACYLTHVAQRVKAAAIATGETADDLAEELLAQLVGGQVSGVGRHATSDLWLRPLSAFTHDECLAYLRERKLAFRTDPDALALTDTRRKLRLLVLPILHRHVAENAVPSLAIAAQTLADDASFLTDLAVAARGEVSWQEADGHVSFDRARWAALPTALRLRLLADAAGAAVGNSQRPTLNSQLDALDFHCRALTTAGSAPLAGLNITLDNGRLRFMKTNESGEHVAGIPRQAPEHANTVEGQGEYGREKP